MYNKKDLLSLLFFDIETLPQYPSFSDLPHNLKKIWLDKYHYKAVEKEMEKRRKEYAIKNDITSIEEIKKEEDEPKFGLAFAFPSFNEIYIKEAPLYPEFGKVYCISFGFFNSSYEPAIETLCEDSEKETIENFLIVLNHYNKFNLSGYNISDFDIPYVLKRMWLNQILSNYPPQLQLKNAKPWTVKHEDHMINYKAGGWVNIGLGLMAEIFGLPSPKDEFNNDEFSTLFMQGKIKKEDAIKYCEKDVRTVMNVMLKCSSDESNFEPLVKKVFAK